MSLTEFEKQRLLATCSFQESVDPASLNLSCYKFGVEGMKILAPVLSTRTALTYLNISYNRLGVEGVTTLAPVLSNLTSLKSLDISSNKLGDEGITRLAPVLSNLTSLTHLYFRWNNTEFEGVRILYKTLYNHPSIYCCNPSFLRMNILLNRNRDNHKQRKVTLFKLIWNDQKLEPDYSYQSGSTGVKEFE